MRIVKALFCMTLLSNLFCGCLTNYYDQYYVDMEGQKKAPSVCDGRPVQLKVATTEDDVLNLLEDGYFPVGYSSFYGPYTPMALAVDTAEDHGACLVLLDIRFKENKQYTSVMYLPSYSTTYNSGTVNATAFGQGGSVNAYGTYSGTSHTTTMNAVPVQRNVEIYNHDAMYFKKANVSNMYGVQWNVPNRLPTEKIDAPITVRIMAVIHGTKAERDGLKRGQIVKKVNDIAIVTRKDIAPFLNGEKVVKVEAEDAK